MSKKGPVIAIDGPSGVGKTTVSSLVAERLKIKYINTGSMYRAVALAANDAGIDLDDDNALKDFCSKLEAGYDEADGTMRLNGKDYTGRLRTQEAGQLASIVSSKKPVRDFLVAFQRKLGEAGSVVMEGRDIGTVVFPDADFKFFLDAPHEVRAKRRHIEIAEKEEAGSKEVSAEIMERDKRDSERAHSPLRMAPDAFHIDTGELSIEGVVQKILNIVNERLRVGDFRS